MTPQTLQNPPSHYGEIVDKIFQSSLDLIALYGTDLTILSLNPTAANIMGVKEEEVVGRKLLDVFPHFTDTKAYYDLVDAVAGKTIHNDVYKSELTGRYYENFLIPLLNEQGEVYAVLAIAHDNTNLLKATEEIQHRNTELEKTHSFLKQLIDSSVEYISVLDTELRYLTVNKKFEETMGMDNSGLKGKYLFDVTPSAEGTIQHEAILKALKGELTYLPKLASVSKPEIIIDTYFTPLILNDQVAGVIISARNITNLAESELILERKNKELKNSYIRLEDLYHELQVQKELDEKKDNFILMASHELKTPVTVLKGYMHLLLEQLNTNEPDEELSAVELLKTVLPALNKQVNHLTTLITELLDLSKIDRGIIELELSEFNLAALAKDVINDMHYGSDHELELSVEFNCNVLADKGRITQVLINYITNAMKYSATGKKINIRIYQQDALVCVTVEDFGIGIATEHLQNVFERFYRVEGKKEKTYPGFGIGLFIVQDIIKRHGGSVFVKSRMNEGSLFGFTLPFIA